MEAPTKQLFKVFHFVFNKPYSLNSETGIEKYKVFKQNLAFIKEHNSKNLSWTLEVNILADTTSEERKALMGINPINTNKRGLLELDYFDKYADVEDDPVPPQNVQAFEDVNHVNYLSTARNQGGCGSCWAFAAALTIESSYNIKTRSTTPTPYISVQQIVDCSESPSQGCSGGWMSEAYRKLSLQGVVSDSDYKYEERYTTCRTNGKAFTKIAINKSQPYRGCSFYSGFFKVPFCTKDLWYSMIKTAPVSVVLNAEENFSFYKKGIIDSSKINCTSYNHAVVAYAFLNETGTNKQFIKIRNSWGASWGDKGDISYYYNQKDETCWVTKMGFQPILA